MPRNDPHPDNSKFITLASICVVIAALYLASEVLIPLALAVLLTFLMTPLVRRFERARIGRVPSVLTVVTISFVLLGVLGFVVADQLYELAKNLDQYQDNIIAKLEILRPKSGLLDKFSTFGQKVKQNLDHPATTQSTTQAVTQPAEAVAQHLISETNDARTITEGTVGKVPNPATQPTKENPLPVAIVQPTPSPFERLWGYLGLVLSPLGTAGLVIIFTLFMLLQREDLRDRLIRLVGYGRLNLTTQALDDAAERISRYLLMQAIVNGTYGAAIALGLWIIGLTAGHNDPGFPNAVLWGLLCAVLRFVPYIGPWIAAAFPVLISLAVYRGFGVFGWTISLFVVIELFSNNVMEPVLYGSSTGMSTVAILVAAVFWTWLWGPIGLLMATPLTVCLVVLGKYVPQLRFLDIILGDEPVLAPHERVYQRWLAMDQEEVAELVTGYLGERSLEEIYDQVLLPALAMAEVDRHKNNLDERRREFIRKSLRELIDELGDEQQVLFARTGATTSDRPADVDVKAVVPAARRQRIPNNCTVNVVSLPSHDEADEIVGMMLTQLLNFQGYCAKNVSVTALASEMVEQVKKNEAHIVIVSAMPPAAATHARYLCKRLHMVYPELNMVVGLWTMKGNLQRAKDRITCVATVQVTTALAEAIDQIEQMSKHLTLTPTPAA
ncbi:MAG TPA: AI-2E family transporter [Tepidisphaeraceae bacterium]|jgi:predicted PurR-regulated permease PerM